MALRTPPQSETAVAEAEVGVGVVGLAVVATPLDKIFHDELAPSTSCPASPLGNVVHAVVAPPASRLAASKVVALAARPLSRTKVRGRKSFAKADTISLSKHSTQKKDDGVFIYPVSITSTNAKDLNWLTHGLISELKSCAPDPNAEFDVDGHLLCQRKMISFAEKLFYAGRTFENSFQMRQFVDFFADMYGFYVRITGTKIICGCSVSHVQGYANDTGDGDNVMPPAKKKRIFKRSASEMDCPFSISFSPLVHQRKVCI